MSRLTLQFSPDDILNFRGNNQMKSQKKLTKQLKDLQTHIEVFQGLTHQHRILNRQWNEEINNYSKMDSSKLTREILRKKNMAIENYKKKNYELSLLYSFISKQITTTLGRCFDGEGILLNVSWNIDDTK